MNHFKTILNHEFQNQLKSFKFLLVLVITLLVTLFCVFIQVKDFAERKEQYNQQIERKNKIINEARVFSEFAVPIVIKPNPLSIFAKGYDEKLGNEIMISWKNLPEFSRFDFMRSGKKSMNSNEKNPFLNIFTEFDVISIVMIILSILAIFVVADAISGEREKRTLQLVYTNPVKRAEFFTAKYLSNLAILLIPLLGIFLSATIMIVIQPFIQVEPDFYLRVLLIFIGCFLFISVFTLITLSISATTSSGSKSLIYGLLIWMFLVFVYPNSVRFVVEKNMDIPSFTKLEKKKQNLYEAFSDAKDAFYDNNPLNKNRHYTYHMANRFFTTLIGATEKYVFEYKRKEIQTLMPALFETQNKMMNAISDYRSKLLYRQHTIENFSFFIPNHLLEQTGTKLANTDRYARDVYIRNQAQRFRQQVLDYVRSKNGFGYKFFTQMEPKNMKNDMEAYPKKYSNFSFYEDYPKLKLSDIPKFSYKKLFRFPVEIFYLAGVNLLLFVLGSYLFMRSKLLSN